MQMNKYAKKWVKALRSKEYKQTRGQLHVTEGGFCCLGVACDVLKDEVGGSWEVDTEFDTSYYIDQCGSECEVLPDPICALLFGEEYDDVIFSTFENTLVDMNDNRNKGFVVIANTIEKFFADYKKPRKKVSK